ncbi:MAG: outer membrane lipoprotein [Gammaproteobacteria bacterium]
MRKSLLLFPALLVFSGCALNSLTGNAYNRAQVRSMEQVTLGRVVNNAHGRIAQGGPGQNGSLSTWLPAGIGAAAGGIAANSLGGGRGKTLLTIAGVVGGALAGRAIGQAAQTVPGVTLTISVQGTCSGPVAPGTFCYHDIAVTQQRSKRTHFKIGEMVEVLTARDGTVRVQPAPVLP